MKNYLYRVKSVAKIISILVLIPFISACAHPITINPIKTPDRIESKLSSKKAAYVMNEEDRNKQVTSSGGGGDKVTYYPYRDSEKAIRDALRSVYTEVIAIKSINDAESIKENNISIIYIPVISTASSSDSAFTWPPTYFRVELTSNVIDLNGKDLSILKVSGSGNAEFSEFKINTGLAGSRALSDLSEKLRQEILKNPALY
jgi:hypothetical protein